MIIVVGDIFFIVLRVAALIANPLIIKSIVGRRLATTVTSLLLSITPAKRHPQRGMDETIFSNQGCAASVRLKGVTEQPTALNASMNDDGYVYTASIVLNLPTRRMCWFLFFMYTQEAAVCCCNRITIPQPRILLDFFSTGCTDAEAKAWIVIQSRN